MDSKKVPSYFEMDKEERLQLFKQAQRNMISTSINAYNNEWGNRKTVTYLTNYTRESIEDIIKSGNLDAQRKLSENYFYKNGFYRRILIYYATLLKYVGILIPKGKKLTDSIVQKKMSDALAYLDKMKLPIFCTNAVLKALIYGTYFGLVLKDDKNSFAVLDLPYSYCASRYKDFEGNDLIEFDLRYFDSIVDEKKRKKLLSLYPEFIQKAYKQKKKTGTKWVVIPAELGICLPFLDGRPSFLNIIPASLNYEDAVQTEKLRDEEDIKKIIVQQIPHNSANELLFEPEEAESMHAATVQMLKGNKNISVLTTYADIEAVTSKTTNDTAINNLEKMMNAIYYESGASSQLFGTTSNLALEYSIKNDIAFIMSFVNLIGNFVTNFINNKFSNNKVKFKYTFLPVSYYTEGEFIEDSYKLATTGYSFIIPGLAMGISQQDLLDIKILENSIMKLQDYLIPLQTSFTQSEAKEDSKEDDSNNNKTADASSGGQTNKSQVNVGNNKGGRPKSATKDLSPKTQQNQQSKDKQQ